MMRYTIRKPGLENDNMEVNLNFGRAIKFFCLECLGWSHAEVEKCSAPLCALHPFRKGRDESKVKKVVSDEMREAARVRMTKMQAEKRNNSNKQYTE